MDVTDPFSYISIETSPITRLEKTNIIGLKNGSREIEVLFPPRCWKYPRAYGYYGGLLLKPRRSANHLRDAALASTSASAQIGNLAFER